LFESCVCEEEKSLSEVSIDWQTTRQIARVEEIQSFWRRMRAIGGVKCQTIPHMLPVELCSFSVLTELPEGRAQERGES
jgi:hypothetical protein